MRCPLCARGSTRVVDSRPARSGQAVRRRRECLGCGDRFTTWEAVERRPVQVLKRDGSAEEFRRDKVRESIALACVRRPVSPAAIDELADRIEDEFCGTAGVEVPAAEIGEAVMNGLEPLDRVAYIRFASVYRNFQHIDDFQDAVEELNVKAKRTIRNRDQGELALPDAPLHGGSS